MPTKFRVVELFHKTIPPVASHPGINVYEMTLSVRPIIFEEGGVAEFDTYDLANQFCESLIKVTDDEPTVKDLTLQILKVTVR